jgi:hypothetical protein
MLLPPRGQRLAAYDACRREFIDECSDRCEGGARIGGEDSRALDDLAMEIAGSVMGWRAAYDRLDLARDSRSRRPTHYDPIRAAALVAECVFDELLSPAATRLLYASLALAEIEI